VIAVEQFRRPGEEHLGPHLGGFAAVLRFLIKKEQHLVYSNGERRPNQLLAFILLYARVTTMWCVQDRDISQNRGYELLCDLENLSSYFENSSTASDSRIAFAFPQQTLRPWDAGHFSGLRSALFSIRVGLYQFALKAFSSELAQPASSKEVQFQNKLLRSAEDRLKSIRNLEVVKDAFFRVKPLHLLR
jgi:hypothetical protein